jgi:hypothetical protein
MTEFHLLPLLQRREFLHKSMVSAAAVIGGACSSTQRVEDQAFELAEATVTTLRSIRQIKHMSVIGWRPSR